MTRKLPLISTIFVAAAVAVLVIFALVIAMIQECFRAFGAH